MAKEEEKKKEVKEKSEVEITQMNKIAEMKEKISNMVDPKEFKSLQKQYKELLDDYVNKREPEPKPKDETRPVSEIAKDLSNIKNGDVTNRDYIETALEYRQAHIEQTGKDPFTDFSEGGPEEPNGETNKVANVLKTLLDENKTPTSFRIALNETLKDDPKLMAKLRKRAN